jgi:hypothetical protein
MATGTTRSIPVPESIPVSYCFARPNGCQSSGLTRLKCNKTQFAYRWNNKNAIWSLCSHKNIPNNLTRTDKTTDLIFSRNSQFLLAYVV